MAELSRRGFIGIAAAAAAGVKTAHSAAQPKKRDYSRRPERVVKDGFFGDGTKVYCLSNRDRSMMLSTVFVSKDGRVAVVDGGEYADYAFLADFLVSLGGVVDHWFITHAHSDHYGALSSIMKSDQIKRLKVGEVVYSFPDLSWYRKNEPKCMPHIELLYQQFDRHSAALPRRRYVKGERIKLGSSVEFEVLNDVDESITFNAVNNSSICMTATIAGKRLLVTGDLGAEGGDRLLRELPPEKLRHDIVFMAHHGQAAVKKSFYAAVAPKVAIWPTTDWIWDNVADFGLNGMEPGPGSGNLNINYYKCWMQELDVKRNFVLTKDYVLT